VVGGPGIAAALQDQAPEAKSRMQIRKSTFASLARRAGREDGQVLLEYALLLALVAVVSIGVLGALGADIKNLLFQTSSRMSQVSNP
jgi:Flp pilus assembly pilin Flp